MGWLKDRIRFALVTLAMLTTVLGQVSAQGDQSVTGPQEHVYATHAGVDLKAYVFLPATMEQAAPRSAIVIFHGGGWHIGSATWGFARARHFAGLGMVAISAQYRLSDQKSVTPLEAMADARAVMRWVRSNADSLGIAADRIAAYGWSAGAHLATCAAIFDDALAGGKVSSSPNALILMSPAVSLENDAWPQRLLGDRATVDSISPDKHVRKGLPPTIILQGRTDTVVPLAGVQHFHELMLESGNQCQLHVYDGVGHLFTPSTEPDDGTPNPDPEVQAAAYRRVDEFLASLGFIGEAECSATRDSSGLSREQ